MKVKHGFVSNSSSTSFFFIFKGEGKDDFRSTLEKNKDRFDLIYFDYTGKCLHVRHKEIFDAIFDAIESDKASIYEIDGLVDYYQEDLDYHIKDLKSLEYNNINNHFHKWCMENIEYIKKQLDLVNKAKRKGFNKHFIIDFGDNHGTISGSDLAVVMDCEGRNININNDDLILFTELNR